jgi:hypothetical protein
MPQHKSRKELRLEAAAASSALASLDTPEGLAGLIFQKCQDDDFSDAFRDALDKLRYPDPDESAGASEKPELELAPDLPLFGVRAKGSEKFLSPFQTGVRAKDSEKFLSPFQTGFHDSQLLDIAIASGLKVEDLEVVPAPEET